MVYIVERQRETDIGRFYTTNARGYVLIMSCRTQKKTTLPATCAPIIVLVYVTQGKTSPTPWTGGINSPLNSQGHPSHEEIDSYASQNSPSPSSIPASVRLTSSVLASSAAFAFASSSSVRYSCPISLFSPSVGMSP